MANIIKTSKNKQLLIKNLYLQLKETDYHTFLIEHSAEYIKQKIYKSMPKAISLFSTIADKSTSEYCYYNKKNTKNAFTITQFGYYVAYKIKNALSLYNHISHQIDSCITHYIQLTILLLARADKNQQQILIKDMEYINIMIIKNIKEPNQNIIDMMCKCAWEIKNVKSIPK